MKIQIVSRWDSGNVLFEHETTEERQASGLSMRDALEAATSAGAYLSGADLSGAYLIGAYLSGAYLSGADLSGADLSGAYLSRAYLSRADLSGAYLSGAYLSRADLSGAYLSGAYLSGAYLSGADLSGADLSGAKWRDGVTISRAPLICSGLRWEVHILDQHMQIGCQLHTLAEWAAFDDAAIVAMDGRDALRFWRAHKDALLSLAASDGRGVVKQTAAAA